MLAEIEKHYGPRPQSSVIYNGRSPQCFNPYADKEDIVLSAGRLWDAAKQVAILAEKDCGWPVIIAGETEHPDDAFPAGADSLAWAGKVELKGKQTPEQLQSLFASAAIYAATSCYEPFGLAPLEAALSRCAIVANDIPTFRELWGETACYFRAHDPDSLRETIGKLRNDRMLRRHHAELAYLRARRRFSADRMVDEYVQLYSSLVPAKVCAA
jgi:glycosyltransferase involved in cell wall biosynthesis